jgi:hypothetical protein
MSGVEVAGFVLAASRSASQLWSIIETPRKF